jgi:LmbE family N-acetylglucosaminyl deacetylase
MKTSNKKRVLAVGAHPDDVEILCAGTLALLKNNGWDIATATIANGDCGSATLNRDEISTIRMKEAENSAKLLNGKYYCVGNRDVYLFYDKPTLEKTINLIRTVKPDLVITHSPVDYMSDHEVTSSLVRMACFTAGIKNIETESPPFYSIPYLYYMDALDGKDYFGSEIKPTTLVDISNVMNIKEKMLAAHDSQRSWLMEHHGMDEYIISMKNFSANRGEKMGVKYAEGFRQHLGHAYPQDNILKKELNEMVKVL